MKTLKEKYNADQKVTFFCNDVHFSCQLLLLQCFVYQVGDITDNPNENDTKNEKDDTELGSKKNQRI